MLAGRLWWLAAAFGEPAARLLLRLRLARGKEHPARLSERRGLPTLPRPHGRLLWLHAASVGETVSVLPLLSALCGLDTELCILMTTGSLTSQRLLESRLRAEGLSGRVRHQFVPLDVPRWVGRFLRAWRPQGMALVESELWPNLIIAADRAGVPMALVNARLSARSLRAWGRMPGLARLLLTRFRWIAARSDEDAGRLRSLGAVRIDSAGDLKAAAPALPVDEAELHRLQRIVGGRPILLAACTHHGEEAIAAEAHDLLVHSKPDLLTIIAPRHPARGAEIAARLGDPPRRSLGQDPPNTRGLWICDTLGEMGLLYRLSRIAFIGNSLDVARPGGGHNPFEPARLGCALAVGPRGFNFADAVRALSESGALEVTATADAMAAWASKLLDDPEVLTRTGHAAQTVATRAEDLAPTLARRLLEMMDPPRC